jgi:AcrR family transcriptional regulator
MEMACSPGRRAARKADRRRCILEVAEQSFLKSGYGETSMSTIAAALGGSKTTLWSYFPSKEALFEAVLDGMIGDFERKLDEALTPGGGTEAVLLRFGRLILEKMMSPKSIALHRLLVSEAERVPTMAQAFAERGPDRLRRRLCGWMQGEMDGGRLRPGDPLLAARQFVALCQAGCYTDRFWRPIGTVRADIDADVRAAVTSFLAAWGALVSTASPSSSPS